MVPGLIDTKLTRNDARYAQAMKQSQDKVAADITHNEIEEKVTETRSKKTPPDFVPAAAGCRRPRVC